MKKERQFTKFIENNDWEGETWMFFIPTEGNEEAIKVLIERIRPYPEYSIHVEEYPESGVDALVRQNLDGGYMSRYNKYNFLLDAKKISEMPEEDFNNGPKGIYKGGLDNFKQIIPI